MSFKKNSSHGVAMLIASGSRVSSPGTRYARRTASEDNNNNNNNYRDTERRVAANPQTAENWQLPSTSTIAIAIITQPES